MIKKLTAILVTTMAMTMAFGITVMAWPAVNRCNSYGCNRMAYVIGWDVEGSWVKVEFYDSFGNHSSTGFIEPNCFADKPVEGKIYHDLSSYSHVGRDYAFALCPENFDLPYEVEVCECPDTDIANLAYVIGVYQALDGKRYAHVKDYSSNGGYPIESDAYLLPLENVGAYFVDEPIAGRVYHTKAGKYHFCDSNPPAPSPSPAPTPKKESKKEKAEKKHSYIIPMISDVDSEKKGEPAIVDRDTFKSEAPSKTVIAADTIGAKSFFDMKVHAADEKTTANQKLLATNLVRADANILLTQNIYPRRDLSITENGSLKVLIWNNLPKNQADPVYAVVYNQIDGAYVINGILDANGTATFTGFKLRPASTITICK